MAAQFKVITTFSLTTRKTFVIMGDTIKGDIYKGMYLSFNDDKAKFKIESIEKVLKNAVEEIGLTFVYVDENELKTLNNITPGGILEISK